MAKIPDDDEIFFDQLEFLVWGRLKHGPECKCDDCLRFCRVRDILMEPFGEAPIDMKQHKLKVKSKKAGG